jgi:copper chaperone CopZ
MKKISFFLISFIFLIKSTDAQVVESSFPVSGNCDMCKKRIETALDVKGIRAASWNVETGILTVKFQPSKISEEQIMQHIADVGHDTPRIKASDKAYENLHSCCKYSRAKEPEAPVNSND